MTPNTELQKEAERLAHEEASMALIGHIQPESEFLNSDNEEEESQYQDIIHYFHDAFIAGANSEYVRNEKLDLIDWLYSEVTRTRYGWHYKGKTRPANELLSMFEQKEK